MKNFILLPIFTLTLIVGGCIGQKKKTRSERQMKKIVQAFAGHLYIHYHRYSKRERKDNTGKFKGTWPLNPKAHNPHDKPGVKPMKMD